MARHLRGNSSAGVCYPTRDNIALYRGARPIERLVGTVKRTLRKVLGKLLLYPDQLTTVLAEVEAVVNSRPLAYVGADPHDPFFLTPADFLIDNSTK